MSNSKVDSYIKIREQLSLVHIPDFEKYDISSALAIQAWKSATMSKGSIVKRTIGMMICEKLSIRTVTDLGSKATALLYMEPVPLRLDNKQIYENAVSFLEPCNHIELILISRKSIKWFLKKVPIFIRALKYLGNFSAINRLYFAASIATLYEVNDKCMNNSVLKQTKELLVFQDHEMMQNIAVQYVKANGGITISLQHGQRVYRKLDADYMAFDNFISDYTLLWNQFSKKQYIKAGYPEERLPVVGSTKYVNKASGILNKSEKENFIKKGNFLIGIVLNAPSQFGFEKITKQLIEWAQRIVSETSCQVLIKMHPTDKEENYREIVGANISVAKREMSMQDFAKEITCGIGHASGALVDLIIMNVPVFLLQNDISFPLDLPDECKFTNYMEMKKCVLDTLKSMEENPQKFLDIKKSYYEEDSYEKHCEFFSRLKGRI